MGAGNREVRDDFVHVELECIGSCLLDRLGELQPGFLRAPIEGGDDGNAHGLLGPMNVLGVLVGPKRVLAGIREVGKHLGELPVVHAESGDTLVLCEGDLFLEQGVQHDRRASSVLEALDPLDAVAERGGAGNEGMGETHPQIRCFSQHARLTSRRTARLLQGAAVARLNRSAVTATETARGTSTARPVSPQALSFSQTATASSTGTRAAVGCGVVRMVLGSVAGAARNQSRFSVNRSLLRSIEL